MEALMSAGTCGGCSSSCCWREVPLFCTSSWLLLMSSMLFCVSEVKLLSVAFSEVEVEAQADTCVSLAVAAFAIAVSAIFCETMAADMSAVLTAVAVVELECPSFDGPKALLPLLSARSGEIATAGSFDTAMLCLEVLCSSVGSLISPRSTLARSEPWIPKKPRIELLRCRDLLRPSPPSLWRPMASDSLPIAYRRTQQRKRGEKWVGALLGCATKLAQTRMYAKKVG
ncbi:hypothetical protein BX070DRAFT_125443 [Coemansia spiralis]|nr:hypothetical protein BX070DRAFT_125443 [Coemansia spiralis]